MTRNQVKAYFATVYAMAAFASVIIFVLKLISWDDVSWFVVFAPVLLITAGFTVCIAIVFTVFGYMVFERPVNRLWNWIRRDTNKL